MKKRMVFAALALMAALAIISCPVPEAELTDPNWGELFSDFDIGLLGNANNPADTEIEFTVNGLAFSSSTNLTIITFPQFVSGLDPAKREIRIEFPVDADILRKSNSEIQAELAKLISFHTYELNPGGGSQDDSVASTVSSTRAFDFTFERREMIPDGAGKKEIIVIKIPDDAERDNCLMRLNLNAYTYSNGNRVDWVGDNGRAVASDGTFYTSKYHYVTFTGASTANEPGFSAPANKYWELSVYAPDFDDGDSVDGDDITWEDLRVADFSIFTTTTKAAEYQEEILNTLVGNFRLERFNFSSNSWVRVTGVTFSVDADATEAWVQIDSITPEKYTPYRVVMSGAAYLKTTASYYGGRQTIQVLALGGSVHGTDGGAIFNGNEAFGAVSQIKKNEDLVFHTGPIMAPDTDPAYMVTADKNGRNVVLHLKFLPIIDDDVGTSPHNYSFLPMAFADMAAFNRNFKIAYRPLDEMHFDPTEEVVYIRIAKVVPKSSFEDYDTPTWLGAGLTIDPDNLNPWDTLEITLDSSYTYNPEGVKFLFIAPHSGAAGFRYQDDNIRLGNYDNWDEVIGGQYFFETYGEIPIAF